MYLPSWIEGPGMDVKQVTWGHKWPRPLGQGLQSQRFPQASRARPLPLRTGRRGLSLGPRCGQHGETWDPRPRCAVQEAWGWGTGGTGCISGGGAPWPGGPQGEGGRMCVWGSRSSAPASAKEWCSLSGRAWGSSRASKGACAVGRALPPARTPPYRPPRERTQANGQRRKKSLWSLLAG